MSLNWNIGKVKDYKTNCFDRIPREGNEARLNEGGFMGPFWYESKDDATMLERMTVTTNTLIFATMSVGLGEITEKNAEEFHRRLSWLEREGAYRLNGDGEPVPFSLDEVRANIGMTTNVSNETKAKWNKRMKVTKGAA
jgi:hypothetical protein